MFSGPKARSIPAMVEGHRPDVDKSFSSKDVPWLEFILAMVF
jgi:hypothetical protein